MLNAEQEYIAINTPFGFNLVYLLINLFKVEYIPIIMIKIEITSFTLHI